MFENKKQRGLRVCILGLDLGNSFCLDEQSRHLFDLAVTLAKSGDRVDIPDFDWEQRTEDQRASLTRFARDHRLRRIEVKKPEVDAAKSDYAQLAWKIFWAYEFLKNRPYDVIHCPDDKGLIYYYLQAKKLGLLKYPANVWVHVWAPFLYRLETGETGATLFSDPLRCFVERRCVELSDRVFVQNNIMRDWMQARGYAITPERLFDDPGLCAISFNGFKNPKMPAEKRQQVSRIAFVGRLNQVKGLTTFCYAINDLHKRNIEIEEIAFLGEKDEWFPAKEFIDEMSTGWSTAINFFSGLGRESLIAELSSPTTLPVIPSFSKEKSLALSEVLCMGSPFIATDVGDASLILNERDRKNLLVPPHYLSLADRLEDFLCNGAINPTTRLDSTIGTNWWEQQHDELRDVTDIQMAGDTSNSYDERLEINAPDPLVSVCMAHYNRSDTMQHALDSVLQQTLQNFEIIIVDDGSEAEERKKLKKIAKSDKRIRLVFQKNRYLGAARNTGARHAQGRFLLFMDDDNVAKPNELEMFVKAAEAGNFDILVCFSDNFRGEGPAADDCFTGVRRLPVGPDLAFGIIRNGYGDSNCFMKRSVWEALDGFTEHYRVGLDDHEFFTRATLNGFQIDVLPESLFCYRLNKEKMRRFHVSKRANFARIIKPYLDSGEIPPRIEPLIFFARGMYEKATTDD